MFTEALSTIQWPSICGKNQMFINKLIEKECTLHKHMYNGILSLQNRVNINIGTTWVNLGYSCHEIKSEKDNSI